MSQITALIDTLKLALKLNGFTYADLARELKQSEANVKRMFSTKSFTLRRIDEICKVLDMEITDLLQMLDEQQHHITRLTKKQEQELISDLRFLLVALCARNHWTFEQIVRYYDIAEMDCIQYLAKLDRLKLIHLLPGNRIKLLVSPDFRWNPGGPIERFFEKQVQIEFLHSNFKKPNELRLFMHGLLSHTSCGILIKKMEELAKSFAELQTEDTNLPPAKRTSVGMVLAMRHWELSVFTALKRQK